TNYFGPDSFTFKANDGKLDSAIATVTLTVNPVNDPPVAVAQASPLFFLCGTNTEPLILAPNNIAADRTIVGQATRGPFSGTPPNLMYLAATNYFGPDSFSFKANDGKLDSSVATVTLTVNPVNDPPVAVAEVSPLFFLCGTNTEPLILAPNNIA